MNNAWSMIDDGPAGGIRGYRIENEFDEMLEIDIDDLPPAPDAGATAAAGRLSPAGARRFGD